MEITWFHIYTVTKTKIGRDMRASKPSTPETGLNSRAVGVRLAMAELLRFGTNSFTPLTLSDPNSAPGVFILFVYTFVVARVCYLIE